MRYSRIREPTLNLILRGETLIADRNVPENGEQSNEVGVVGRKMKEDSRP
jgi:hypothetical protein